VYHRAFWLLWGGQLVSLLGSTAASFALGLIAYSETGSVSVLALITGVSAFGAIYLAPLCGAVADHFDRRSTALFCNLALGVVAAGLAGITYLGAGERIPWVLGLVFVSTLLNTGLSVTLAASVRELRTESDLTRVNGVTSLLENGPTVAGPLLGAAVYALLAPSLIFVLDAATFLACALAVAFVRWPPRPESDGPRKLRPFSGAARGLSYIWRNPDLRTMQFSFAGVNLFNGLTIAATTAFVVAASAQGSDAWNLAAVNVAGAIGLLLGSAVVFALATRVSRRWLIAGAVLAGALFGRVLLVATVVPVLWMLSYALRNAMVQICNAPHTAIWQERVPREIQATVFGARRLISQGFYPLAVVVGGLLGDHVLNDSALVTTALGATGTAFSGAEQGIIALVLIGGLGELVMGAVLLSSGALRRLATAPEPTVAGRKA
jgi:DHA3 family macrolide efflux protein-like MFS transporter